MSKKFLLERKVHLPVFVRSEICEKDEDYAVSRVIKQGLARNPITYYHKPFTDSHTGLHCNYNLFPIVLNDDGSPWALACLYILDKLEGEVRPNMDTYKGIADDLGAFKEWIDRSDNPIDLLTHFPKFKQARVTYRYRAFLMDRMYAQEVMPKTANRRMANVVTFYRWLIVKEYFEPDFSPWQERTYSLTFKNKYGFSMSKPVQATDLAIKSLSTVDPFDGTIMDGGKLRPLSKIEQQWVFQAARDLGNPEIFMILLFVLMTGARIQTVGTLRKRHFLNPHPKFSKSLTGGVDVIRISAGPGTGIDTKNDKSGILMVPRPLYELLHTYSLSMRAKNRASLAKSDSNQDEYLFLTQQGTPYFEAKEYTQVFNPKFNRRHHKKGGTVRQFLKDYLIPLIQKRYDKNFHFRIHDLRASFGMNTEAKLVKVAQEGLITIDKARQILKTLMWHQSSATTDLYLDYRVQMERVFTAVNDYGDQVQEWINVAKNGFKNE